MKPEDQNIVLCKMDGWDVEEDFTGYKRPGDKFSRGRGFDPISECIPKYTESYDAIVPLIQKQNLTPEQWYKFFYAIKCGGHSIMFRNYLNILKQSPEQLCEALLRATGKWKESE